MGIRLVGRPGKRWIDSMNGCLKKSLDVGEGKENGA